MTFNGLTDKQAESSRKKYGSNRADEPGKETLSRKLAERFGRIPVKIYIIILLLYIAAALFSEMSGAELMAEGFVPAALALIPALFIPAAVNCLAEIYVENRANRNRKKSSEKLCKVYRCGNTIKEIPAGDIVKGDYVLLTEGDIVPADGIVVYGDVTAESIAADSGAPGSKLIRSSGKEDISEDVQEEYTVERDWEISSGYAVIKITKVGSDKLPPAEKPSAGYAAVMYTGILLSVLLILSYMLCCYKNIYGADESGLIPASACYLSLIFLTSEGLLRPADFFRKTDRGVMYRDGIRACTANKRNNMILADKAAFATDGRPLVTGFTDGSGKTYPKFYEIPYPLGTIIARAAAANTSALTNRGKIIGADPYECAEMNFISERIKNTLGLEITPELISGELKNFSYKKLLKGSADKIIKNCTAYFDGGGKRKALSNTAALTAMAEELSFQGSRVFAYAAEDHEGNKVFIGMITVYEKLRGSAAEAYRKLTDSGIRVVMLDRGGSAKSVSIADKAVTAAASDEIISYEELASKPDTEAAKLLPKLKIITGECDKEYLIRLAKASKLTVGVTVSSYDEIEKTTEADVLYAPSSACGAVCGSVHAVLSGGLESLYKYGGYSRAIKSSAAWYTVLRFILTAVSAFLMSPPAVSMIGISAYYGAIVINLLFSAAACVAFSKAAAFGNG